MIDMMKNKNGIKLPILVFFVGMLSLALGEWMEVLQGEVKKLATPKEEKVMVEGQEFTVVLTPDLEDGGFTAQCREIPGAISQGETEQEER